MRTTFKPCLLAASITLAVFSSHCVMANENINFKKQPLLSAIDTLSKQYNLVIVAPESLKNSVQLSAVNDQPSVLDALKTGLANTNLTAIKNASGSIMIVPKPVSIDKTNNTKKVSEAEPVEKILVVGSYLTPIAGTLPISLLNNDDIAAYGVSDGAELLRMLPQSGDVTFNESNFTGGVNTLRGDVASVNLRSIGTGNTLMLVNGRRMVLHPSWQNSRSVPVVSYNLNTLPAAGIAQMQVMRDGASALYGADAVAGVINTVMINNYDGVAFSARFGEATGIGKKDLNLTFSAGTELDGGKGHISFYAGYDSRNAVPTSNYKYAASADRTPFLVGTDFEGNSAFDNRSSIGGHGYFDMIAPGTIGLQDGTALTNSSGRFHVQPTSNSGCLTNVSDNICVDDGYWSYATDNAMYHDLGSERELYSKRSRLNIFSVFSYDMSDTDELYGELGAYIAQTSRNGDSARILTDQRFNISKNAYWNPFGATMFVDGSANPNRIAGTDVPDEGVDLLLHHYRVTDADVRHIRVTNKTYRALVGFKGTLGDWNYDTALLYSTASSDDKTSNGLSVSKFQDSINKTTPDAYNPFCGAACNSEATLANFYQDLTKNATTELALVDFKVTNPDIFSWVAGDIGFATGVEYRYESFDEDKDNRLDGTSPFTDSISGKVAQSNSIGDSPTNDVFGERSVFSTFAELSLPLVSQAMNIPLVQAVNMQLAARYENLSDVGNAFVPRVAASWQVNNNFMFRGSWSEGFRAPNLVQTNLMGINRQSSTVDYARCTAKLEKGLIEGNLSNCKGDQIKVLREPIDLESETSVNTGYGVVFTPVFIENLTLTLDYWQIEQKGVIGVLSATSQSALDLYYRQNGQTNPNVQREIATPEDIELFLGTGIAASGEITQVIDPYLNLDKQASSGVDYALEYKFENDMGQFSYNLTAARLISRKTIAGEESDILSDLGIVVTTLGNMVGINGSPKWKANSSIKWRNEAWSAALTMEHTGKFEETSASITDSEGKKDYWKVGAWQRFNAYLGYDFTNDAAQGMKVSFGIKNLFNKLPPMADERFGIFGGIHTPEGRYLYTKLNYKF